MHIFEISDQFASKKITISPCRSTFQKIFNLEVNTQQVYIKFKKNQKTEKKL
jgi:hypothetical protein